MALVWQKKKNGCLYEVRSAGNSLRLYTNGVFHTQYNPHQPLTGHVWDLLMLPALFYPADTIRRVLVLGVGGGAVMQMLRHFVQPEKIVGIELDANHLYVARRFFKLQGHDMELVHADARDWLTGYQGPKFDMIIEDLFIEQDEEPVRLMKANGQWFNMMSRQLSANGVLVSNFIEKSEISESAVFSNRTIGNKFSSVYQFASTYNENFVVAFFKQPMNARLFYKHLSETSALNPKLKTSRLRFKLKKLK
ncbi:MAG: fused MFS/spermidine synthase [Gammaproteobacteria bacterium]|nr:fused MFS/spermidine synthase [Gammaproteobacteria bacterium]